MYITEQMSTNLDAWLAELTKKQDFLEIGVKVSPRPLEFKAEKQRCD